MSSLLITAGTLFNMEEAARLQARRRMHHNLHSDYSDPCQRLLNVVCSDSYIPPHCHDSSQGSEALFVIRGLFAVVTFDDVGNILSAHRMGSEKYEDGTNNLAGVQIEPGVWHTLIALSDIGVLLEVKAGPFNPNFPKMVASWAPEEGSEQSYIYLRDLKIRLLSEFFE